MDGIVDQENYEKAFDTYDQLSELRYVFLMNKRQKLWPESPIM